MLSACAYFSSVCVEEVLVLWVRLFGCGAVCRCRGGMSLVAVVHCRVVCVFVYYSF